MCSQTIVVDMKFYSFFYSKNERSSIINKLKSLTKMGILDKKGLVLHAEKVR